VMKKLMMQVGC